MNRYGLLGYSLKHSYSKTIHEVLFKDNNIDASYELIEIDEKDIKNVLDELRQGKYHGFNVTIPYKEKVVPFLDELSIEAKEIGAVNTIVKENNKLVGYNTDYYGFIKQLELYKIDVKDKKAFVLGSGGASKAICYALKSLGASVTVVSRNGSYDYQALANEDNIDLIVNTTPVGMYPYVDECPLSNSVIDKANIIVDIIFNPRQTKLLKLKQQDNGGLPMLIYQAIKAEEIWLRKDIKFDYKKICEAI